MSNEDCNIEILGQKLSYPSTWHGTAAILIVCICIVAVAFVFKEWATPENLDATRGLLYKTSKKQEDVNRGLVDRIDNLTKKVSALEINNIEAESPNNSGPSGTNRTELEEAKKNALRERLEVINLRKKLSDQKLTRLKEIAPGIKPEKVIEQQIHAARKEQEEQMEQAEQIESQFHSASGTAN